jgi:Protein of unknown function (DUF4236)
MTWFLRKSFRLGPFRLNLSKPGLGASVGVDGRAARRRPDGQGLRGGWALRALLPKAALGDVAPRQRRAGAERSGPGAAGSATSAPRWLLVALALLIGLIAGAWIVHAGELARVDLFDPHGAPR